MTEQSFWEGIKHALPGKRISDISRGVQTYVEANGFSVVREYVGHGVGAQMHEAPEVPNYVMTRRLGGDPRLVKNMTIAVEPMVNAGTVHIRQLPGRLDREDRRRQVRRPLRKYHSHHRRRT